MLIRALILILFTSQAWSAGISIELKSSVSVGGFLDSPQDPAPVYEPHKRPAVYPVYPAQPEAILLTKVDSKNEGIESITKTRQTYMVSSDVYAMVLNGAFFVYVNDGDVHRYQLNFDGDNTVFDYPSLPEITYGLSFWFNFNDWDGDEINEWHVMPLTVDKVTNTLWQWLDPYLYYPQGEPEVKGNRWFQTLEYFNDIGQLTGYAARLIQHGGVGWVVSYIDEINGVEGLWAIKYLNELGANGIPQRSNGPISSVPFEYSVMLYSRLGLTQVYNDADNNVHFRYLETDDLVEEVIPVVSPLKSISAKTNTEGTLFDLRFEGNKKLMYFDLETSQHSWLELPDNISGYNACLSNDSKRIFCVMSNVVEGLQLYELISGVLVLDRTLDHPLLTEHGVIDFTGIYVNGDNRFIGFKTVDLMHRLFNFTSQGGFHIARSSMSGPPVSSYIIKDEIDQFYWVVESSAAMDVHKVKLKNIVQAVDETSDQPVDAIDNRDSLEDEPEEVEEEKEIPYVEFSGSFSFYILCFIFFMSFMRKPKLVS
jgi:hypothetical protein